MVLRLRTLASRMRRSSKTWGAHAYVAKTTHLVQPAYRVVRHAVPGRQGRQAKRRVVIDEAVVAQGRRSERVHVVHALVHRGQVGSYEDHQELLYDGLESWLQQQVVSAEHIIGSAVVQPLGLVEVPLAVPLPCVQPVKWETLFP